MKIIFIAFTAEDGAPLYVRRDAILAVRPDAEKSGSWLAMANSHEYAVGVADTPAEVLAAIDKSEPRA